MVAVNISEAAIHLEEILISYHALQRLAEIIHAREAVPSDFTNLAKASKDGNSTNVATAKSGHMPTTSTKVAMPYCSTIVSKTKSSPVSAF